MPDNVAKIILDASADGVLRAADQVKKKFTDVGNEGSKAGEKMFNQLGKAVLSAAALAAVVRGIAEAYSKAADSAAKLSTSTGSRQVKAELAGAKVGLSASQTQAFMNSASSLTADEKVSAISSLSGITGPEGEDIDVQSASRALALLNTGVMDSGRISKAFTKGGKKGLDKLFQEAGRIKGGLSERSLNELSLQEGENAAARLVDETASDFGDRVRLATARKAAMEAENPVSAFAVDATKTVFSNVPLVGPAIASGIDASTGLIYQMQMVDELKAIRVNGKPKLDASSNGPEK